MNTTTERFARRLNEKVKNADYASAVERFSRHRTSDFAFAFAMAVIVFLFGVLWFKGLLPGQ